MAQKENIRDNNSLAGHSKSQLSRISPTKGEIIIDETTEVESIRLPKETMYLIDKVVRQKALQGPIGVDNSELINLEVEEEFKQKHQYMLNLAARGNLTEEDVENIDEKLL